jgi:hypothetical protein
MASNRTSKPRRSDRCFFVIAAGVANKMIGSRPVLACCGDDIAPLVTL